MHKILQSCKNTELQILKAFLLFDQINQENKYVLVNSQIVAKVNTRDIPGSLSAKCQTMMGEYDPYYSPYVDTKKGQFLL